MRHTRCCLSQVAWGVPDWGHPRLRQYCTAQQDCATLPDTDLWQDHVRALWLRRKLRCRSARTLTIWRSGTPRAGAHTPQPSSRTTLTRLVRCVRCALCVGVYNSPGRHWTSWVADGKCGELGGGPTHAWRFGLRRREAFARNVGEGAWLWRRCSPVSGRHGSCWVS